MIFSHFDHETFLCPAQGSHHPEDSTSDLRLYVMIERLVLNELASLFVLSGKRSGAVGSTGTDGGWSLVFDVGPSKWQPLLTELNFW